MSTFKCEVVRVEVAPHPNADQIEIAKVGDFQSIIRKGQIQTGDLAVYIPEQAVVPEWLLREMNMWDDERKKGGLAGSAGNRVKTQKIRGIISQGLILPCGNDGEGWYVSGNLPGDSIGDNHDVVEGDDVSELLGITKYEPPLPSYMSARVVGADFGATHKYDFENIKKQPEMFEDGEPIVITEKIHGTMMMVGVLPPSAANEKYYRDRVIISSKGMGGNGYVLDHNDVGSVYAQAAKKHELLDKVFDMLGQVAEEYNRPVFLLGEVFGKTAGGANIQDLIYTGECLDYRAFDICVGNRGSEKYYIWEAFRGICATAGIPIVPMLYSGPYFKRMVLACTDGPTYLVSTNGMPAHIREGVVVKSLNEARHEHFGRKIAKSISDAYLLRKGDVTEFN